MICKYNVNGNELWIAFIEIYSVYYFSSLFEMRDSI